MYLVMEIWARGWSPNMQSGKNKRFSKTNEAKGYKLGKGSYNTSLQLSMGSAGPTKV